MRSEWRLILADLRAELQTKSNALLKISRTRRNIDGAGIVFPPPPTVGGVNFYLAIFVVGIRGMSLLWVAD